MCCILLLNNNSISQIADKTNITERTVTFHLKNLRAKFKANNIQDLCKKIHKQNITPSFRDTTLDEYNIELLTKYKNSIDNILAQVEVEPVITPT